MTHWASEYIGQPWIKGERDCWSFARRVWADRFNIEVPAIDVDPHRLRDVVRAFSGHPELGNWVEVEYAREGDGVLLAHSRYATHVGIWIDADAGGVLHCDEASGVVFSSPQALARSGWTMQRTYRHMELA